MSADIYLHSIWKRFEANLGEDQIDCPEPSPCTSGYFRISYNDGDVMWAMGLSWSGTVEPMLVVDGWTTWLPVQRARELLAVIEARPLTDEGLARHYSEHIASGVNEHPITGPIESILAARPRLSDGNTGLSLSPDSFVPPDFQLWARSLREGREDLIAILRKSIELDEPLDCWL